MKPITKLLLTLLPIFLISACTPRPLDAFAMNEKIGRGVNLGNALEGPTEGAWGLTLEEEYFQLIADQGFDAVRVPIRWSAHAAKTAPYIITPDFFERIDWVIENSLERELVVIINFHHYEEMFVDPQREEEHFLALWRQVAERYQDYPQELIFEILNEPHDVLTNFAWNKLLFKALDVIRETNPERMVIIGPGKWNNLNELKFLELPEDDRNIIVTFHYYEPFEFTHQGASWAEGSEDWLGRTWEATNYQMASVDADMFSAAVWAEKHNRPIYLGEFGAYSRADMESRARWTAYVARKAEENGFSWAYWEFGAGFGVYDRSQQKWVPPLLEALLPPGK